MKTTITVSECFGPTIQGEGPLIGTPTVFVRTGGCDYRCSWCDTLYAVLPEHGAEWTPMSPEAVFAEVRRLSRERPMLVTLSGGNPALQPMAPLIELGHRAGYRFSIETQGSVPQPWFARLDHVVLSPKPPSSGMATDLAKLDACVAASADASVSMKIVVFDDADYAYARRVQARYPSLPYYLQVGNAASPQAADDADHAVLLERLRWLVDTTLADGWFEARVLPQLHVLVYGNRRGV